MRYHTLGEVPAKRHSQVWRQNGSRRLLVEELLGYEGFSGNEALLYHLRSPCRLDGIGPFTPNARDEWVPPAHVHRLADVRPLAPGGDPLSARRLLMFNDDIEVSVAKPVEPLNGLYRNGEGDELLYIHRGGGVLRSVFGRVPFRERDYLVIPSTSPAGMGSSIRTRSMPTTSSPAPGGSICRHRRTRPSRPRASW